MRWRAKCRVLGLYRCQKRWQANTGPRWPSQRRTKQLTFVGQYPGCLFFWGFLRMLWTDWHLTKCCRNPPRYNLCVQMLRHTFDFLDVVKLKLKPMFADMYQVFIGLFSPLWTSWIVWHKIKVTYRWREHCLDPNPTDHAQDGRSHRKPTGPKGPKNNRTPSEVLVSCLSRLTSI